MGVVSTSHDPNYLVLHILFGSTRGTRETGYFCFIMLWCAYIVVCQSGFSQILSKSKANFVAIQVFLYSLISWEENVYKYLYIYIYIKIQFLFVSFPNFFFEKVILPPTESILVGSTSLNNEQ